jgi:hypothetical protein
VKWQVSFEEPKIYDQTNNYFTGDALKCFNAQVYACLSSYNMASSTTTNTSSKRIHYNQFIHGSITRIIFSQSTSVKKTLAISIQ